MNRQRGMSSLSLVLLLLLLGTLMLNGLNQQLSSHVWRVNRESQGLRRTADIHSAMVWARNQAWPSRPLEQCRQPADARWRSCLRIFDDESALLIVGSEDAALWQSGVVSNDNVRFLPHGWSDFCPLNKEILCQLP